MVLIANPLPRKPDVFVITITKMTYYYVCNTHERRRRRRETFGSRAGRTCAVRGRRLQTAAVAAGPAGVPAPPPPPPSDDR